MENYVGDNENMIYFFEWVKQLFGESEGKNNKGVLPISTIFPRDLHSLGQFIQDGNKIIFETFITFKDKNEELDKISNLIITSAMKAHYDGHVPIINIELDSLNEKNIAMLIYFFLLAASFSAYLFDVYPFDQPGVEVYKSEISKNYN